MTRLPDMRVDQAEGRKDIKEAVEQDRRAKERQKQYKDRKCYVKITSSSQETQC